MSTEIRIPGLGVGMSEGTLVQWHVADRAEVKAGELLYTLESEKTAEDIEAPVSGVIRRIGEEGQTYPVGQLVAVIE